MSSLTDQSQIKVHLLAIILHVGLKINMEVYEANVDEKLSKSCG